MVKRYDLSFYEGISLEDNGSFVHYDDYAALKSELDDVKEDLELALDAQDVFKESCIALDKENKSLKSELDALREQVRWRDAEKEFPSEFETVLAYRPESSASEFKMVTYRRKEFSGAFTVTRWMPLPTVQTSQSNKD